MKAITYLKQIELMDAKINTRLEEIERLNALATKTTSSLVDDKVQSSSSQQKMADCVAKIISLQEEINAEIDRFIDYKQEVRNTIESSCDSECIKLLHSRYFMYKTWEQIAVEMNFTYQWVAGGLHQRALAQVQKELDRKDENNEKIKNNI